MVRLKFTLLAGIAFIGILCGESRAQDTFQPSVPEKEHAFLQKFVGNWETSMAATFGPDQPAVTCTGKITGKMLGGLWLVNEMESTMVGQTVKGLQTVGFDPQKKKYVGTWVDSMMNYMWSYTGTVKDEELTLAAEGPSLEGDDKTTTYEDIYEFTSKNEIKITSRAKSASGEWVTFMTGTAKRK